MNSLVMAEGIVACAGDGFVDRQEPDRGQLRAGEGEARAPAAGHLRSHLSHRGRPHDPRPHLQQQVRISAFTSSCPHVTRGVLASSAQPLPKQHACTTCPTQWHNLTPRNTEA